MIDPSVIDFVTEPDVTGQGRIKYKGLFYGLPVDLVEDYKRLLNQEYGKVQNRNPIDWLNDSQ